MVTVWDAAEDYGPLSTGNASRQVRAGSPCQSTEEVGAANCAGAN